MPLDPALRAALTDACGAGALIEQADALAPYAVDERQLYHGVPAAVVRPGSTGEVATVVGLCRAHGVGVVPQGGNTGYCGGATPDASGTQLVVSLERLDRVLEIDPVAALMTVQAGVRLAAAQQAAAARDLLLPLAMGSQASCQIGGNLATNAGGLAVLRYGTARDLTLGLEVVLPDGRVLTDLRGLRKDNTGYDLKQLFIGAEGTLGIITAATLRLYPRVDRTVTAFAAVADAASACAALPRLRALAGDSVTSFEYLEGAALALVTTAFPTLRAPFDPARGHFVLLELAAASEAGRSGHEEALAQLVAEDVLADAVLAQDESQRRALWALRERVPAAERHLGGSVKHDVAVRQGAIPQLVAQARAAIVARWPQARLSVYGHLGDGNIHFNVLAPAGADPVAFRTHHAAAISASVHAVTAALGGSFSAEHGVGVLKRELLSRYGDPLALELMRTLKRTLDPAGLMNPGKLL
ncbi:MAG: FAD-binding oxidoreductase [Gammaproteobacteria bacterium]